MSTEKIRCPQCATILQVDIRDRSLAKMRGLVLLAAVTLAAGALELLLVGRIKTVSQDLTETRARLGLVARKIDAAQSPLFRVQNELALCRLNMRCTRSLQESDLADCRRQLGEASNAADRVFYILYRGPEGGAR